MRKWTSLGAAALIAATLLPIRADAGILGLEAGDVFRTLDNIYGNALDMMPHGMTGVRIGLGPVAEPSYDGDPAMHLHAAPLISFRYKNLLEVDNNQIRVNIIGNWGDMLEGDSPWSVGPAVRFDFGRKEDQSPKLKGLGNVGTSIETGAFVGYTQGSYRSRLRIRRDLISGHSGLLIDGDFSGTLYRAERFWLIGGVQVTWTDSKYNNSFFGVTTAQSIGSGLPVYRAHASFHDVTFNLIAQYVFNAHWSVLGNVAFTRLLGSPEESPLVSSRGSPNLPVVAAFAIYSF